MGSLDSRWNEYLSRLRSLLCRSGREEGDHVLHKSDVVERPQRPRDRYLPAILA